MKPWPRKEQCPRCHGLGRFTETRRFLWFFKRTRVVHCGLCDMLGTMPVIRLRYVGGVMDGQFQDCLRHELGLFRRVPKLKPLSVAQPFTGIPEEGGDFNTYFEVEDYWYRGTPAAYRGLEILEAVLVD